MCLAANYLFTHRVYTFYSKAVALIAWASIVGLLSLEIMVRLIYGTDFRVAPSMRHPSKVIICQQFLTTSTWQEAPFELLNTYQCAV